MGRVASAYPLPYPLLKTMGYVVCCRRISGHMPSTLRNLVPTIKSEVFFMQNYEVLGQNIRRAFAQLKAEHPQRLEKRLNFYKV